MNDCGRGHQPFLPHVLSRTHQAGRRAAGISMVYREATIAGLAGH